MKICSRLFYVSGQCIGNRKERDVESLRDIKRAMEREARKGSCPLMFERLEFGGKPFQTITTEEKLDEVLAYLLRVRSFSQFAGKTVINNVYMDMDLLCRKPEFKRTHSVMERERVYAGAQRHKKKIQPDYGGRVCLETAQCIFTLPDGEAERYRAVYDGQETYAFPMSNKYILGLFTCCVAARKEAASTQPGDFTGAEQGIVRLDSVGDVLFQALLLDDVEYGGRRLSANLHTIYCLKEGHNLWT